MSFVLSRNDAPEPSKFELKDRVVQIIGRGSLRDCNDARVSREHASLTTEGETLILRSLHLKPCFYRKRFSDAMSKLSVGESVELFHGDFFGLLPDTHWYELIYIKKEDAEDDKDKAEAQTKNIQPVPNETKNYEQSSPTKRPHTPNQDAAAKKMKTELESPMKEETVLTSNKAVVEPQNNNKENHDEGNLARNNYRGEPMNVNVTDNEHDNDDVINAEFLDLNDTVNSDDVNQVSDDNKEEQSLDTAADSSNKDVNVSKDATSDSPHLNNPTDSDTDVHSPGDEVAVSKKVVKKEPESPTNESVAPLETSSLPNSDNTGTGRNDSQGSDTDGPSSGIELDVKKEPQIPDAAQPGPSKDQPEQAGPSNDGAAPAPPNARPRERCLYGANCYRKNAQHKAQFCHPGDADYGACEKAQCPYGAQCYRTDPRHWLTNNHPDGTNPPQRVRNGIRVVQRRGQFFYINAHAVHFNDNHYAVEDEDGQRVDYDYEF